MATATADPAAPDGPVPREGRPPPRAPYRLGGDTFRLHDDLPHVRRWAEEE
ncbi:hypothetical protein STENM223S_09643 [Streptomyces tendae]